MNKKNKGLAQRKYKAQGSTQEKLKKTNNLGPSIPTKAMDPKKRRSTSPAKPAAQHKRQKGHKAHYKTLYHPWRGSPSPAKSAAQHKKYKGRKTDNKTLYNPWKKTCNTSSKMASTETESTAQGRTSRLGRETWNEQPESKRKASRTVSEGNHNSRESNKQQRSGWLPSSHEQHHPHQGTTKKQLVRFPASGASQNPRHDKQTRNTEGTRPKEKQREKEVSNTGATRRAFSSIQQEVRPPPTQRTSKTKSSSKMKHPIEAETEPPNKKQQQLKQDSANRNPASEGTQGLHANKTKQKRKKSNSHLQREATKESSTGGPPTKGRSASPAQQPEKPGQMGRLHLETKLNQEGQVALRRNTKEIVRYNLVQEARLQKELLGWRVHRFQSWRSSSAQWGENKLVSLSLRESRIWMETSSVVAETPLKVLLFLSAQR